MAQVSQENGIRSSYCEGDLTVEVCISELRNRLSKNRTCAWSGSIFLERILIRDVINLEAFATEVLREREEQKELESKRRQLRQALIQEAPDLD